MLTSALLVALGEVCSLLSTQIAVDFRPLSPIEAKSLIYIVETVPNSLQNYRHVLVFLPLWENAAAMLKTAFFTKTILWSIWCYSVASILFRASEALLIISLYAARFKVSKHFLFYLSRWNTVWTTLIEPSFGLNVKNQW